MTKDITLKRYFFTGLLLILAFLPILQIFFVEDLFIPTEKMHVTAFTLFMTIGVIISIWQYRKTKIMSLEQKIKYETQLKTWIGNSHNSALVKLFTPIGTTCLVAGFLYGGLFLSLGQLYTTQFGQPFSDIVLVPEKNLSRSKACLYQYRVNSPQFTSIIHERNLCISNEDQEMLPDIMGVIFVSGKISNWGRNISDHFVPTQTPQLKALYSQREKIIQRWRKETIPTNLQTILDNSTTVPDLNAS